ncbi:bifunctional riboflavin kinase/FAD synthetase [Limnobacter parvus]|uniref:Riboflavin biosynthesis protein n=1 Tax=Limnobacter parvus TaxID=2939690 RepID=A0ABT1XKG6_9BURK|nr:bifunctional riboflavin kinase/FAD synthetase [Limnobacter parvus]MCR2747787.1 bifunctional riboflavin kinase/FAD synthetase [Limnobacter parvus]
MKIIRRPRPHTFAKGTALTIGNFDGVHSGHAELFRRVVSAARAKSLVPTVVTLHPHPKEFFNPEFKLDRISTLRDRIIEMKGCGIEQVCILPFNKHMASLSPEAFVQEVLLDQLNAKQIWVGDDFRFGAKRAGDFALLSALGDSHGFVVNDLAEVQSDGSRVSSSSIREALKAGDVPKATHMLGHPLVYSGHIVHGKKLGRTLGFPTMNLKIAGRASALTGILAVWVHGIEECPLPAVASMGVRPTVEQSDQILLETFIPEWQGNAYGKLLRIEVLAHIRPEQHFDSLDAMVVQMHQDTKKAMALLAANQPQISNTGC